MYSCLWWPFCKSNIYMLYCSRMMLCIIIYCMRDCIICSLNIRRIVKKLVPGDKYIKNGSIIDWQKNYIKITKINSCCSWINVAIFFLLFLFWQKMFLVKNLIGMFKWRIKFSLIVNMFVCRYTLCHGQFSLCDFLQK